MFNRKEFNERITKEYDEFVNEILKLDSKEVFDKSFEISFKKTAENILTDIYLIKDEIAEQINEIDSNILNLLFELYDDEEGAYILDDIVQEIVEEFLSLLNEEFEE